MPSTPRSRAPGRRSVATLLLVTATVTATVTAAVLGAPRSAADPTPTTVDLAARWLAGEVRDDTLTTGGVPDPGLAADAALALAATGRQSGTAERLARRLLDDPGTSLRPAGPGQVLAGAAAKLVLLAIARGEDPRDVDGEDLVAALLDRVVVSPGATDDGRLRDRPPSSTPALSDRSNVFTQALGALALARTGAAPGGVVGLLVDQQCPSGGFRLFLTGGRSCASDAAADADTTSVAVLALSEVAADDPGSVTVEVERALDWLESAQRPDGALSSSGPGASANANSTGLAALALRIGGRTAAADRARDWVTARQLRCSVGAGDAGAIAFTASAQTAAATGIPTISRDQFRRSTSQALLAFADVPLGSAGPAVPGPTQACADTTSTVPTSSTPTSTLPTSTVPTSTGPSSTVPSSTVPSSTGPGSGVPDSTLPVGTGAGTAVPANAEVQGGPQAAGVQGGVPAAEVQGVTVSRSLEARLAATGGAARTPVVLGLALTLVGGAVACVAARRRSPW